MPQVSGPSDRETLFHVEPWLAPYQMFVVVAPIVSRVTSPPTASERGAVLAFLPNETIDSTDGRYCSWNKYVAAGEGICSTWNVTED